MSRPSTPAPSKLRLPEVVELLLDRFECTEQHARDLLERAIHGGSLQDVTIHYPDGDKWPTDITAWRDVDWESGYVMIEPSWAGSPPELMPVIPLFSLEEIARCFGLDTRREGTTGRGRAGRPLQHDWDAFWIEVCRRLHEEGLPATQKELSDGLLGWLMDHGDETIDARTVEKKISELFAILNSH